MLGDLYSPEDTRRDAGFSIYYMGVNLGALFGPLLTGLLQGMKGFHWGFGLAAVGMALGLTQYLLLRRRTLGDVGHTVANPLDRRGRLRYGAAALVVVLLVVVLVRSPASSPPAGSRPSSSASPSSPPSRCSR